MEHLLYFILLSLVAEILGTVGGFGSSLFFVPLAGLFFDFHAVLGITALFHLSSNISKIALFRQGFDKKLVINMGIPAVVFVIAGAFFSKYINAALLEALLAGFLIIISLILLIFKKFVVAPTSVNSSIGGALSGITAGLLGTGGAIRGLTLAAFNMNKETFIATSAIIDLGIDFSRSIVYFVNGYIQQQEFYLTPLLFAVGIVGTFSGKKLLTFFSQQQFKYFSLSLILIIGLTILLKQFS